MNLFVVFIDLKKVNRGEEREDLWKISGDINWKSFDKGLGKYFVIKI